MHHTFKKYHDLPAAIAIGLYLLGAHVYIVQTIFMTDTWRAARDIGNEAAPIVRIMGATYLGFAVGLILTFINGPDGQRTFFNALLVAQVLTLVILWQTHFMGSLPVSQAALDTLFQDAIAVSVLTALLLFGCFKLRSRL